MGKNTKRIVTTALFGAAGTVCLIWFVLTLRVAIVYSQLGNMEAEGDSILGDLFATFLGSVYSSAAVGVWIEVVIFAVAGGLLLFATYKAYKSKWGKRNGAFVFAIISASIVAVISLWSLFAGGLAV